MTSETFEINTITSPQFKGVMSQKNKEKEIKKERKKLQEIFKNVEKNKLDIVEQTIEQVAFMGIELLDLKEIIKRDGMVELYANGAKQYGKKQSAASQAYNALFKVYTSCIKQLIDLLPVEDNSQKSKVLEFLSNGKK